MQPPILLEDIWKTYGKKAGAKPAVSGLSLSVPPKSVYGFLGPNGAGKSTTIRMILGLQRPDRGKISLFGQSLASNGVELLRRVGSLVEAPSLYPHLTGRENLEVHRRLLGGSGAAINRALELVDLLPVSGQLVRNYSSGMKQRLGLAIALFGKPDLLVLDEPTNGLDPAGIHEVRTLIRDLPRRSGVTVFLSSHLLAEVEQAATHLAIISQGTLKFEGTPRDLQLRSGMRIIVTTDQPERAEIILRRAGCTALRSGGDIVIAPQDEIDAARINSLLVQAGLAVSHLSTQHPTLEELFLQLTTPLGAERELAHR